MANCIILKNKVYNHSLILLAVLARYAGKLIGIFPNKMHVTLKFVDILDDDAKKIATEKIREVFANEKFPRLTVKPKGFKVLPQFADKVNQRINRNLL